MREWQKKVSEAQETDQKALDERLKTLQTDQRQLVDALGIYTLNGQLTLDRSDERCRCGTRQHGGDDGLHSKTPP